MSGSGLRQSSPSESKRPGSNITSSVQWLADRQLIATQHKLTLIELATRFGPTDADAAEAILLAGNYSICRRAFG